MAVYFSEYFGVDEGTPSVGSSWYYANQQDVEDVIGVTALVKISNEPDSATSDVVDSARLVRIGELVDQIIDAKMSALGYVTPMTVGAVAVNALATDHPTRMLMKDISAKLVIWKLNEPRMLTSLSSPTARNASQIDKIMDEHRKAAELTLRRIAWRSIAITADKHYATMPPAKVYVPSLSNLAACPTNLIFP